MISVVMPVHNEGAVLEGNAKKLVSFLKSLGGEFELLLVENGSSDDTLDKAKSLSEEEKLVRYLSTPEKDLGAALRKGILNSRGKYLIWYPIDLSIDLEYIPRSLELVRSCDIVVGSKEHPDSVVTRSVKRKMLSFFYNSIVNLLFGLAISDTQCVKTFKAKSVTPLAEKAKSSGIMWEVELLYLAKKEGLCMLEVPVSVSDTRKGSKIRPLDMLKAFVNLVRLRLSYKKNR